MRSSQSLAVSALVVGGLVGTALAPIVASSAAAPLIDCVSSDNGDPVMTDVSFSTPEVDVTNGPQKVTVMAQAHDTGGPGPAVGLRRVEVSLEHGNGELVWAKMQQDPAGTWVGSVTVPRWTKPGRWTVSQAFLVDKVGQETLYGNDEEVVPFTNTFRVLSIRDGTRPTLKALSLSAHKVNTRRHERRLKVTARATDDRSGIATIIVGLRSTAKGSRSWATLQRKRGTANVYVGRGLIRRWVGTGRWRVWIVVLVDRAENYKLYYRNHLDDLGVDRAFDVVSGRDSRRPRVVAFKRSPAAVDVRTSGQSVTITVRAKDAQSGVAEVSAWIDRRGGFLDLRLDLVSGTPQDGVWRGTAKIRQCPAASEQRRLTLSVSDVRGNERGYSPRDLRQRGWPPTLRVIARPDAIRPRVRQRTQTAVPVAGPVVLTFNEAVNGISDSSMRVRRLNEFTGIVGPVLPGQWTCKTGSGAVTDCSTGRVRQANFRPDHKFARDAFYDIELNPPHSLEITDLAGNPFDRDGIIIRTRG